MSEKIQKILANAGLGSRRQIETWISDKRISINGVIAKLGDRIEGTERVAVDGREVKLLRNVSKKSRILLYHKPEGEICSRSDPEGRPTVFDHLPLLRNGRWISVGRLDFNTSGILLLTNDGELANQLMHPSSEIEREYAVRIIGEVPPSMLTKFRKGIKLEDGYAVFNTVADAGGEGRNHWYHVMVKEGRNRLVRRVWESQGMTVSRLIRIRFGSLHLPREVRRGKWTELEPEEVMEFIQATLKTNPGNLTKPAK
jgi:23S rRNA pseudouridine2605 synthase